MRNIFLTAIALPSLLLASFASNAYATPHREQVQETIVLGNNRFLIFTGILGAKQYGYMADLIKIEHGIPHFDSITVEEYETETGKVASSDGVAFRAVSYRFDKAARTLDYTTLDNDSDGRTQYKYQLVGNTLALQEVIRQDAPTCANEPCPPQPPKTLYKAEDHAQAH